MVSQDVIMRDVIHPSLPFTLDAIMPLPVKSLLTLLCLTTFLLVSEASTFAAPPPEETPTSKAYGETTLSFAGLARARLATQHTTAQGLETPQTTLVMARLRARATHHGAGLVNIELDMLAPTPLLDLYSEVDLGSPVSVRVGLFKVPLSREMLLPIVSHPVYERSLINLNLGVRRRAGATIAATFALGELRGELQTGVFNPTMNFNKMLHDGVLWVSALNLKFAPLHTDLHIAYMDHVFEPAQTFDMATMMFLYPRGQQLDVALYHEHGRWRALAEGLIAFDDRQPDTDTPVYALHGLVAYQLGSMVGGDSVGQGIEPAMSMDYLSLEDGDHLRVTGNLHWLIVSRKLMASAGYGFEPELGMQQPSRHLALMQLQGSF